MVSEMRPLTPCNVMRVIVKPCQYENARVVQVVDAVRMQVNVKMPWASYSKTPLYMCRSYLCCSVPFVRLAVEILKKENVIGRYIELMIRLIPELREFDCQWKIKTMK